MGEEAIERTAAGMGGKSVGPLVLEAVAAYHSRPEWKYRRAAIASLARLAEGARDYFKSHLTNTIDLLAVAVNDACFRVQYEVSQTLSQFYKYFLQYLLTLGDSNGGSPGCTLPRENWFSR